MSHEEEAVHVGDEEGMEDMGGDDGGEYYDEGEEGEEGAELGEENGEEEGGDDLAEQLAAQQQKIAEEEQKLKAMMKDVEAAGAQAGVAAHAAPAVDENSIYVGQVDYEVTPEELQEHFKDCGTINRVTILCDKMTGRPKGYAYIEFLEEASVDKALSLDNSLLKGRPIKVTKKRHNIHGFNRGRGRGGRRGRGGFRPRGRGYRGGFRGLIIRMGTSRRFDPADGGQQGSFLVAHALEWCEAE